ncbi:isocitrate dehydrogenase kinase/phosphatase-domain containing protein, partial [Pseudoalteromonas sp. S4741]|uniref:isocitrate dehydrogenase kinase/phosphatase-domain containing protein n=1 Tax=Pseudoalteromonas sp. S4741 TaxID=579563 RepID=UPI00110A4E1F
VVTRWGRVEFYDYDEICPLTDCNFREVPNTENPLEEISAHSYFDIDQNDIFPSQVKVFFSAISSDLIHFNHYLSDLFTAKYWP